MGENRIKRIDDNNFTVASLQGNCTKDYKVTKEYKVVLTNNNGFPSYECADWKNNMLPCRHMFAIFEKIGDWSSLTPYPKSSMQKIKIIYVQGIDKTNKFFDISCTRRRNFG